MRKAIILAAGLGNRLRPFTDEAPKCLVQLIGKSLLERQLAVLESCGIDDVLVVGGYKAEKIEALGHTLVLNKEFETTNMVWSLFEAKDHFGERGDLIIGYGDIVYEKRVLEALLACTEDIGLVSDLGWRTYWEQRTQNPLDDVESFRVSDDGYVGELGQKPESRDEIQGQFTGLIKIRAGRIPELFEVYSEMDKTGIYDGQPFEKMYMTSFIQHLIDLNWRVKAVPVTHGWLELDTVDDLTLYENLDAQGRLDALCRLS